LAARRDLELRENLAQVAGDGVLTDEQPRADVDVRQAIAGEPGDLSLLRGEGVARLNQAGGDLLAGRGGAFVGPFGECLPAQILPVEQMGAGELRT
jgi:hypothetical protein